MERLLINGGLYVLLWTVLNVYLAGVQGQDIPVFFFSKNPQDQDVVEGKETTLDCDISDRSNIQFHWTLDGKSVTNTSRRFQEDSNLRILRVIRGVDEGAFRCIATHGPSSYSIVSQEGLLNIQWIDKTALVELRRPKEKFELTVGTDMMLRCQVTGNPEPSYLWYRNKFRIFPNDRIKILDEGSRLRINGLSASDNGIYSCRAENVASARDSSVNLLLNLQATDTPHLLADKFTQDLLVERARPAILHCPFVNATRVDWYSNYEKLTNNTRHMIFGNGSLYFPRVRPADEGSYRCEGLSKVGTDNNQAFSSDLALASLEEFGWNSFEPRLRPNFPMVVPVNMRFELKCFHPKGKPLATLRWLDRNSIQVSNTGRIHVQDNSLVFENAQEIDSGNYTCIANNMAGEKRKVVWIIVSVPPIITKAPQPINVEEEQKITFECQYSGTRYPVTTISWTKDSHVITPAKFLRHRVDTVTGLLEIFNVQMADAGNYACLVNTSGHPVTQSSSAYLTVKRKLKFKPVPANPQILELHSNSAIQCHAEAETRPTVRWLRPNLEDFRKNVQDIDGLLIFDKVVREDAGPYMCVAHSPPQLINITVYVEVVVKPKFEVWPMNMTVKEEQSVMLHCFAKGDPKPNIVWDRNSRTNSWDINRFEVLTNGSLLVKKVLLEDKGKYGCTANNSGGIVRVEAFLDVASASEYRHKVMKEGDSSNRDGLPVSGAAIHGMGMMKTVIIAVCSAGAYLALVIGLTAFCSYRLLMQRRTRKALTAKEGENGELAREQMELLHKENDRDSTTQVKSDSENRSHISGMSSQPSHSSQSQTRSRRGSYDRLQFPRHDLQTIGMLGKGIYGNVFLAKAQGIRDGEAETLVVVKSLLTKDEHIFFEFRQEMDMYSRLEHPNVVKLLGVCREAEPQFLITEYCDWGDLKQFLLATRQDNGKCMARVPPLSVEQKLHICKQVALGMEHLSNYRFIHKDLASRNVLLTSHLEVKISSLSLCQDIYSAEYYLYHQAMIPLRWMPPEAVLEDDYSTKSDVWSFGVFVWEVFHSGDLPHKARTDEEILKGMRAGDVTLEISEHCPEEVTDLIRKCTIETPLERPLFGEICIIVSDILMDNCSVVNSV